MISVELDLKPSAAGVPSSRQIEKTVGTFGKSPLRTASKTFRFMRPPRPKMFDQINLTSHAYAERTCSLVPLPCHSIECFTSVCTSVHRRQLTASAISLELQPHAWPYDLTKLSLYEGCRARKGDLMVISLKEKAIEQSAYDAGILIIQTDLKRSSSVQSI